MCQFLYDGPKGGKIKNYHLTSLPTKATKRAKKQVVLTMLIEELKSEEKGGNNDHDGGSGVKSASETLLELCRGARERTVGFVALNANAREFVTSKPKPLSKMCLMIPEALESRQEFRPINRDKPQELPAVKEEDDCEQFNVEKPMSKREEALMTKDFEEINKTDQKRMT